MKITETFIADILKEEYPADYQKVYDNSPMLQYLDKKMKAVHGNSKTRRSLKNHYKNIKVYFGYSRETIAEVELELYKTGRTNANDGGIDFVMRPVGRFFQVTEVNNYSKYLLDIDKVMHFPISFVIKTKQSKKIVLDDLEQYITMRSSGMTVLEERYRKSIEEIITINELETWTRELGNHDIDGIIRDIDIYYKMEMNMDAKE